MTSLNGLSAKLKKARGRPIAELRERARQAVLAALEARGWAGWSAEPTSAQLQRILTPRARNTLGDTPAALGRRLLTRAAPAFFSGVRTAQAAAMLRTSEYAAEQEKLVEAADRILQGRFDLLGYTGLSFGDPVDWHLDPIANKRAPRVPWSRVPYLDPSIVGDHKIVWELSRHQHFMVLGRAFQVTGRRSYADYFAREITSWMDENPPKTGINWASSLEVAYRAIAWVWSLELFREADAVTPALAERMLKFLYVSGTHVERNLSTYFSPNTHLTGEALGLYYLGVMYPELRRSARWRTLGWAVLERELFRQVHTDGVYFEQSTYYHRYTVDIFLHAVMLRRLEGGIVPPEMTERLGLAAEYLAAVTRGDGRIPLIGDDDGGRLVSLEERSSDDVRATLEVATVVLGRGLVPGEMRPHAAQETLWMVGNAARHVVSDAPSAASASRHFPIGGSVVMRHGLGADELLAHIDGGPLGAMNCGHSHSDSLSLTLSLGGCPVLVDPGTFTYTTSPADRDLFRHSAMHNTVTVDGESASVPGGPFSWKTRADVKMEEWWSGPRLDWFVGSHGGFERLPDPARHRRSVLFVRGEYWIVFDTVLAAGPHEVTAHFHVAPEARVVPMSDRSAWIAVPCAGQERGLFFATGSSARPVEWDASWVSPAYGSRVAAPYAKVTSSGGVGRQDLVTVLCPGPQDQRIRVGEISTRDGIAVVVDRWLTTDLILFDPDKKGMRDVGGVDGLADCSFVRWRGEVGGIDTMALFGKNMRLVAEDVTLLADGAAEAFLSTDGWVVTDAGHIIES